MQVSKSLLLQPGNKRKRKVGNDESNNNINKTKNRRYRRGCVADEVPSTILLDNDDDDDAVDDEERDEEEPGEITDEVNEHKQQKTFQPFDYESESLATSTYHNDSLETITHSFIVEKFKKPADDEDIYEPNRPKKTAKAKVGQSTLD